MIFAFLSHSSAADKLLRQDNIRIQRLPKYHLAGAFLCGKVEESQGKKGFYPMERMRCFDKKDRNGQSKFCFRCFGFFAYVTACKRSNTERCAEAAEYNDAGITMHSDAYVMRVSAYAARSVLSQDC